MVLLIYTKNASNLTNWYRDVVPGGRIDLVNYIIIWVSMRVNLSLGFAKNKSADQHICAI